MTRQFRSRSVNLIHCTAVVHPQAQIGVNVSIGPYAVIGAHVEVGDNCEIGPNVCIDGWTRIGRDNRFYDGASIGYEPQDVSFKDEETYLYIGDHNVFREKVTVHRGTASGSRETRIGSHNLLMSYSHVAHDCLVGDYNILLDGSALAGHVTMEDYVMVGKMSGIHQFCKVGSMVKIGSLTKIVKDVPPYVIVEGNPAGVAGVNLDSAAKNHIPQEICQELLRAYDMLYRSNLGIEQALETMEQKLKNSMEIEHFIRFIRNAKRGIQR